MLDPTNMDAEMRRAYGLDTATKIEGAVVRTVIRLLGWSAYGIWLGSALLSQYVVMPVAMRVFVTLPRFIGRYDTANSSADLFMLQCGQLLCIADFVCWLILLFATFIEARESTKRWYVSYAATVFCVPLIGVLMCTAIEVAALINGTYAHMTEQISSYEQAVDAQVVLLVLIGVLFAWLQTSTPTSPNE